MPGTAKEGLSGGANTRLAGPEGTCTGGYDDGAAAASDSGFANGRRMAPDFMPAGGDAHRNTHTHILVNTHTKHTA